MQRLSYCGVIKFLLAGSLCIHFWLLAIFTVKVVLCYHYLIWSSTGTPFPLGLSRQIFILVTTSHLWYDILVLYYWDFPLDLLTASLLLSLPSGTLLPHNFEKLAGAAAVVSSWGFPGMSLSWQIVPYGYSFSIVHFLKSSVTLDRSQISELLCFLLARFSVVTSW